MIKNSLNLFSCVLFLLLLTNGLIYGQQMVEQNKLWSYYTDTGLIGEGSDSHPTGYTTIYSFGAPEINGSHTYYRLQTSYEFDYQASWENTEFLMREDSIGRVYLKEDGITEILIYDFSLETGDFFEDQINGCTYQLASKDSVTLNSGGLWERFNFTEGETWIKGIGSIRSLIPGCDSGENNLICFQTDIDLEYTGDLFNQTSELCYFVPVSTKEIPTKVISIFPNPVWHSFTIQSEEEPLNGQLIIYNSTGQRVYQETVRQAQRKEIFLSPYPTGIYYLELGEIRQKLIKVN